MLLNEVFRNIKIASITFSVLGFLSQAHAQHNIFPSEGIPLSQTIMIDANAKIEETQRMGLETSKAQASILSRAYNQLLKQELKKPNPDHNKINRWYMQQASKILNLDPESERFFRSSLEAVNPSNPFLYRSKEGKNYLAFPPIKSGNIQNGSLVSVEEHFNAHMRDTNIARTFQHTANPKHAQFFPREYGRFMSVSYAVTWEMCQVQWSSTKSILSFESLYKMKDTADKKDPLCEENFIKSLQDPVGWLGFYAFIMTNHTLAPRISNYMFSRLGAAMSDTKLPFLNKQIAFYKFFTGIVSGGLGMTAGLTASDYVHQMKENPNLKACFKNNATAGWFGEFCQEAYKDFLLINTASRDRMTISAMSLLSAFGLNTAAQVPLQMAVHGARLGVHATKQAVTHGVRAGMHVALGLVPLGPGGWAVGAIIYVGSTYLFLRFDHMVSPHIEKWYYGISKPKAIRDSINDLVNVVHQQDHIAWEQPLSEREPEQTCFKEKISGFYDYLVENNYVKRVFEGKLKCDNPILLDEALRNFSLSMSEHRNMNILSGVSSTISLWQSKWSGFYYNYIGSMEMLDLIAYYRRTHKERLGRVNYVYKYGFNPEQRSSIDVFDELYNPLYGFETELLDAKDAVSGFNGNGIDHPGMVRNVHQWIKDGIEETDKRHRQIGRATISWTTHHKPYLEGLLQVHDPLVLAEKLLKLKQMMNQAGSYATQPILQPLRHVFNPVFPFARDYFGSSTTSYNVPLNRHFTEFRPEQQNEILQQRQAAKCQGSIEGEGICSLTPEEILELTDSYIPHMANVSVDLGYDMAAGSRYHVDAVLPEGELEYPKTFDPNCYTMNIFGSDNPTCWFSKGIKDSNGQSYDARYKTPLFSDHLLANMACGISNRAYLTTSDGPKNFLGSGDLFKSENFSALFTPPNLLKGAPACQNGTYNFGGRYSKDGNTADLHRSFIRVNNKEYYGALSLLTDPSNPWIVGDDINSIESYWNTNIFPTAKTVAQNLFKQYQKVIAQKLLPLFSSDSRHLDYQNLITGSKQLNVFKEGTTRSGFEDFIGGLFSSRTQQTNTKYIEHHELEQFTTDNLRESFIQQARLYLQLTQKVSDLSDQKAEEILNTINNFITAMQRANVDYNLEGEAFLRDMKAKKAYHDNIMERRSNYLNQLVDTIYEEISSPIEWINRQDRARYMSQITVADGIMDVDQLVALRIVDVFLTVKEDAQRSNDPNEIFGYDNYQLKNALLFEAANLDRLIAYLKPLFEQFDKDQITVEQLLEKLNKDSENSVIELVEVSSEELFKDWLLYRVKSDLFGLIGELKAQYLDEWIHGNKFYLNNLQLEE